MLSEAILIVLNWLFSIGQSDSISFSAKKKCWWVGSSWLWSQVFMTSCFCFDIFLNFRTTYLDEAKNRAGNHFLFGLWMTKRCCSDSNVQLDLWIQVLGLFMTFLVTFVVTSASEKVLEVKTCKSGIYVAKVHFTFYQLDQKRTKTVFFSESPFRHQAGEEVRWPCLVAKQYLRSWFLLDFVTAVPFEHLTDAISAESVGGLKLLRTSKIFKILKPGLFNIASIYYHPEKKKKKNWRSSCKICHPSCLKFG